MRIDDLFEQVSRRALDAIFMIGYIAVLYAVICLVGEVIRVIRYVVENYPFFTGFLLGLLISLLIKKAKKD